MFDKNIKVSNNEFGINPLYCVSLPGYTWQCGLKWTGIKLQTLQDKDLNITLEDNIRGGMGSAMSAMGDRNIKSDEKKKIFYMDATNLYGHSMIQLLSFVEIEMWHGDLDLYKSNLEEISNAPDGSDIGYFVEANLGHPDIMNKKKLFHFVLKIRLFLKIKMMII